MSQLGTMNGKEFLPQLNFDDPSFSEVKDIKLFHLVQCRCYREIKKCIYDHPEWINYPNNSGWTPFMILIGTLYNFDELTLVTEMIDNGANVNQASFDQMTPLLIAIRHASPEYVNQVIKILLHHNININVSNKDNKTPIDIAIMMYNLSNGNPEYIEVIQTFKALDIPCNTYMIINETNSSDINEWLLCNLKELESNEVPYELEYIETEPLYVILSDSVVPCHVDLSIQYDNDREPYDVDEEFNRFDSLSTTLLEWELLKERGNMDSKPKSKYLSADYTSQYRSHPNSNYTNSNYTDSRYTNLGSFSDKLKLDYGSPLTNYKSQVAEYDTTYLSQEINDYKKKENKLHQLDAPSDKFLKDEVSRIHILNKNHVRKKPFKCRTCPNEFHRITFPVLKPCDHASVCINCLANILKDSKFPVCPKCRASINYFIWSE